MHAPRSTISDTPRRPKVEWGLGRWLMLLSLALLFSVTSGCATRPRLSPETAPELRLTAQQTTSPCLRGRLPDPDWMDVGDLAQIGFNAEARATCEATRADGVVSSAQEFNRAFREWLDGARR